MLANLRYVENTGLCFPYTLFKVLHHWCVCLCQLSGLALLGVGVWMLVDPDIISITKVWADASHSELLRVAAIVLVVVGGLLFIISLMGIIGAVIENKVVLGIVRTRPFYLVNSSGVESLVRVMVRSRSLPSEKVSDFQHKYQAYS